MHAFHAASPTLAGAQSPCKRRLRNGAAQGRAKPNSLTHGLAAGEAQDALALGVLLLAARGAQPRARPRTRSRSASCCWPRVGPSRGRGQGRARARRPAAGCARGPAAGEAKDALALGVLLLAARGARAADGLRAECLLPVFLLRLGALDAGPTTSRGCRPLGTASSCCCYSRCQPRRPVLH